MKKNVVRIALFAIIISTLMACTSLSSGTVPSVPTATPTYIPLGAFEDPEVPDLIVAGMKDSSNRTFIISKGEVLIYHQDGESEHYIWNTHAVGATIPGTGIHDINLQRDGSNQAIILRIIVSDPKNVVVGWYGPFEYGTAVDMNLMSKAEVVKSYDLGNEAQVMQKYGLPNVLDVPAKINEIVSSKINEVLTCLNNQNSVASCTSW